MPKLISSKNWWYYLTHSWEDKWVHTFPKCILLVIPRLEFELAYYDSAVNCFNHYTAKTPPRLMIKQNYIILIITILLVRGGDR